MESQCESKNPMPKDPILHISQNAQDVFINSPGFVQITMEVLRYMVHNINLQNLFNVAFNSYVRLSTEFHPERDDERAADWLFVLNTLNFALWPSKNEQEWRVDGLTGYLALCAAIKRAIDDDEPIWNPRFYTNLSIAKMEDIFRGDDTVIPRISQRLELLHRVGEILCRDYNGTFAECIKLCQGDSEKLFTIVRTFPSYDDKSTYDTIPVYLHIKAWTLIQDIGAFFKLNHELHIKIEEPKPTIFVDYRVPQILNHFKALVYSKNFMDNFEEKDEFLTYGSREELEIRCCSLMITKYVKNLVTERCELVKDTLLETQLPGFSITRLIDNFLWDYQYMYQTRLKDSILCKISTEQY